MLSRLASGRRGAVMVEYALSAPVLLLLYLCGCGLSDAIACNRKVAVATRALADLVSRRMSPAIIYNDPASADATSALSASAVVLAPYRLDAATEQISLLRVCDATHAYVVWTAAQTQGADGSNATAAASTQSAGTLPAKRTQPASSVVSLPAGMITAPMIPKSPDRTNVCANLAPGTSSRTQVGTAGGWLFMARVTYEYVPGVSFFALAPRRLLGTIYMVPRLY